MKSTKRQVEVNPSSTRHNPSRPKSGSFSLHVWGKSGHSSRSRRRHRDRTSSPHVKALPPTVRPQITQDIILKIFLQRQDKKNTCFRVSHRRARWRTRPTLKMPRISTKASRPRGSRLGPEGEDQSDKAVQEHQEDPLRKPLADVKCCPASFSLERLRKETADHVAVMEESAPHRGS